MDLKQLLGEAYHEEMTAEEISAALSEKELVDKSVLSNYVPKDTADKFASEAAKYRKELNAIRQAQMTEEEKRAEREAEAERERQAKEQEVAEIRKLNCRLMMEKEFASSGLGENQYAAFIENCPMDDPESAVMYAKNITKILKAQAEKIRQSIKEEVMSSMGMPSTDPEPNPYKAMTLTEMMAAANEGNLNQVLENLK